MRLVLSALILLSVTMPTKQTKESVETQSYCADLMDQAMDAGVDVPDCGG